MPTRTPRTGVAKIRSVAAEGREARISKTSGAGNWGAVTGNLRYFADRFGTPRASIEGTTLSYDLIREHAAWSAPDIWITGDGKRAELICEGDHRGPGSIVFLDLESLTVIASARIGVFPDGITFVPPPRSLRCPCVLFASCPQLHS